MSAAAVATWLIAFAKGYLVAGAAFAVVFSLFLVRRLDPAAAEASLGFRLIIMPGVALLWPLLCWRSVRGTTTPTECNAHRTAAVSAQSLVRRKNPQ